MNGLNTGLNVTQISHLPLGGTGPTSQRRSTTHEVADDTLPPREEGKPPALKRNSQDAAYIPRSSAHILLNCHLTNPTTSAAEPISSQWTQTPSQSALTTMPPLPSPRDLVTLLE